MGFSLGKIDGKLVRFPERAHRVSYQIYIGSLGVLYCLHTCDNKLCVNPGHLFKATQLENIHDAIDKGLIPDKRSLDFSQAQEIRRIYVPYSKEFGCRALGRKYGIPFQHISLIIHRKTYNRPWKDQGSPAMI